MQEYPKIRLKTQEILDPSLAFYSETQELFGLLSGVSNLGFDPRAPEEVLTRFYRDLCQEIFWRIEKGGELTAADLEKVKIIRSVFKMAQTRDLAEEFARRIIGEPIKIWGQRITEDEAHDIVEKRLLAIENHITSHEVNATEFSQSEKENLRRSIYKLVAKQYEICVKHRPKEL